MKQTWHGNNGGAATLQSFDLTSARVRPGTPRQPSAVVGCCFLRAGRDPLVTGSQLWQMLWMRVIGPRE